MSLLTRHRRTAPAVHPLSALAGESRLVGDALALVREAGVPYHDWLLGGEKAVLAALSRSIDRPSSEFAGTRIRLLVEDGRAVAVFVALGGAELATSRKADTLAAIAAAGRDRDELLGRIRAAGRLFLPVPREAFYLSRIAVPRALRGRGFGRAAMAAYLAAGRHAGFDRFCLDVAAGNGPAIELYGSFGFEVEARRDHAGMSYLRMAADDPEV